MKGEGCKVSASQANYSLMSRPPSWKVGEMGQTSSYWERPRLQLSHFLGECSTQGVVEIQFGAANAITFFLQLLFKNKWQW